MRTSLILAAAAMLCVIGQETARAEGKPNTPAAVAGKVTKVDPAQSRVTLRASDGTVHEFEASKETLQGLKVGDRIEAKRRAE
jgi:Cu/Ag efflux protein CusF